MAKNNRPYGNNYKQDDSKVLEQEGRVPPQAVEVEEAVLGAMLIEHGAATIALQMLKPTDFYKTANRHIFETLTNLYERDNPLDLLTVENELKDNNLLDICGGPTYLSDLTRSVSSSANIEYHAQIIIEKAIKRNLILGCNDIIKESYDTTSDAYDVLDHAEQSIFDLSNQKSRSSAVPVEKLLKDTLSYLENLRGKEYGITGVPTGLAIDDMTAGWQKGDLVIIAARPSMGKTAFVLTAARNAALHPDENLRTPIALFSLEMSNQSLVQRLLTMEARVRADEARKGTLKDDDFRRLIDAASRLFSAEIYIDDTPSISLMELRTKCRRLKTEKDIGLIIVDYLQLMQANSRDIGNREQEIATISRGLKALAKELDVPVIALAQLSRAVEQRGGDKRPQLSDLRESGCLSGDTLITLADTGKQIPIKDLEGKSKFEVWSLNNQTKKLEKSVVTKAFCTGIKQTFLLQTQLGRSVKATANHKFLTIEGWKRLDEIGENEYLALPRKIEADQEQTIPKDKLALLGHLIGDGCTLPKHAIQYTTKEKDLAELVANLSINAFGDDIKPRIKKERTWYQVYLASTKNHTHNVRSVISDWLREFGVWGLRSYEKKIPEIIFSQPKTAISTFLRHLWVTDGCIKLNKRKKPYPSIYYASSSKRLALDVQGLLLRFNINARIKKVSQGDKGRDQYHVIIGGKEEILSFVNNIGTVGAYKSKSLKEIENFIIQKNANTNRDVIPKNIWDLHVKPAMKEASITHRKLHKKLNMSYSGMTIFKQNVSRKRAAKLADVVNSDVLSALAQSDIYWDKVVSKTSLVKKEKVYDLTVPGNHNFIANNIIVHNSIEQDADIVMFLYRPEYYGITTTAEGQSTAGLAEIIVGKQRNGPVGSKMMYFVKEYARFENLTSAGNNDPLLGDGGGDGNDGGTSNNGGSAPLPHNPAPDEDAPF